MSIKTFPCDFNAYEDTKDGLITATEFTNYAKKHGYDVEQTSLVFSTLDSNGIYLLALDIYNNVKQVYEEFVNICYKVQFLTKNAIKSLDVRFIKIKVHACNSKQQIKW